jgi:hypothetical protein
MRKLIKLTNNYHNTSCNVRVRNDGTLSKNQVRRAWGKLCGSPHCTCGDVCGCRPARVVQIDQDGRCKLIVV